MSSAITVYCGLFFISDTSFKEEMNFHLSEKTKILLFSVIVIPHMLFLGYWVYHFIKEMRDTIRGKLPRIYLTLFLCCNKSKLDHELEVEQYVERMGPFLGSLERSIDCN